MCLAAHELEFPRWTPVNVKLLLPPRQSRGDSLVGLGIDLPEMLPGTRANMTGPVSAALTYGEWIAAQADEIQRKALGDERATLMRVGGLASYQLYDASGTYLSIDRLRTLFPVAFAICGMR